MIDFETRNRYGEAVLNLVKLTQEGKLQWSRKSSNLPGYEDHFISYQAQFEGKMLQLRINMPWGGKDYLPILALRPDQINLTVLDSGGKVMEFPWVVEMEALVQAVYAKVSYAEDSIISAINRAANG